MTLDTVLGKVREAHFLYQSALTSGGKGSERTRQYKEELLEHLIWGDDNLVFHYVQSKGRPVSLVDIGRTAFPTKPPSYIYDLIESESDLLQTFYDTLRVSGAWEFYRGEQLQHGVREGKKVLVSNYFPGVIFSYDGIRSDVSWIPRLMKPDSSTIEAAGILLFSGTPVVNSQLGIVDKIIMEKQPYERTYVDEKVTPLLSYLFNVPPEFFRSADKPRQTKEGVVQKPFLSVASQMVGSYFQYVAGIFEVDGNAVHKKPPVINNNTQRRAFLRAALDNGADMSNRYNIRFQGLHDILEVVKECWETLGYETGEVKPVLTANYKLTPTSRDGDVLRATTVNRATIGRKVFEKTDAGPREVGIVLGMDEETKEASISLGEEPKGELYQESSYRVALTGGRDRIRDAIQYVRPSNTFRLLTYLRALGCNIPTITRTNPLNDLQQLVSDEWDGDLDRLVETLRKV